MENLQRQVMESVFRDYPSDFDENEKLFFKWVITATDIKLQLRGINLIALKTMKDLRVIGQKVRDLFRNQGQWKWADTDRKPTGVYGWDIIGRSTYPCSLNQGFFDDRRFHVEQTPGHSFIDVQRAPAQE
jgi:hypothetical protein